MFDIVDLFNDVSFPRLQDEMRFYRIDLDTDFDCLYFFEISDVHRGSRYFSEELFMHSVHCLLEVPNLFASLNGDLCESSLRTSKGDIFKQVGTPQDQWHWMTERLYPVKHKLVGMDSGNHEDRIYNETGIDISLEIATALGIPYRSEGMLSRITFGHGNDWHPEKPYVYDIYSTHGFGGARTKAAKAVKVERLSTFVTADMYCMSHDHDVNIAPQIMLEPDSRSSKDESGFITGKVNAKRKMLIKTNAYLKWGGYSERGGFAPTDLCTPIAKLAGKGKPRINVAI